MGKNISLFSNNLEDINTPPGNFEWSNENVPLIEPEWFVYDNSTGELWEDLVKVNCYPKPKDNSASNSASSEDNFGTYNNTTFARYFNHTQGSITPREDTSLDAWYDIGLKSVMFVGGTPYATPNFQKSFYVWYLKGDGTDYPYTGHTGYIYPGQEFNYPYKYNDLSKAKILSGNIIKIKGDTPLCRFSNTSDGFYAKLLNPNEKCNCIAKVDLGLLKLTGQKYHYQGFTLVCKSIFSKVPKETINLDMRGDDVELDITSLIDVNLGWEFDVLTFVSSDPSVCTVETNWVKDPNDRTYTDGPDYIKLKGNPDVLDTTVTITVTAQPINTTYKEVFSFKVRVRQLYNKETQLTINPKHIITMVGIETEYEVITDASSYTVTTDKLDLIRIYKGKIKGVKQGSGVLVFSAQAPLSKKAIVKVPFTVNKYIPTPEITVNTPTVVMDVEDTVKCEFITNCPKANTVIESLNEKVVLVNEELVWEDLETDKEYPKRKCTFKIRGITEGKTNVSIGGYITEGDTITNKLIMVTVLSKIDIPEPPKDDENRFLDIKKSDAYLAFHNQHQGTTTYLRSEGRNLSKTELDKLITKFKANKIYIVPEVKPEDIKANNNSNEFTLALMEDITNNEFDTVKSLNNNYIDYKEDKNPKTGFTGNDLKPNNIWVNKLTMERFISTKINNVVVWKGDKGTMINDIDYPFPGEKGFGTGPAPHEISMYYGLTPLKGCWDKNSDNYGNYKDKNGNIYVYVPRHYIRYEKAVNGNDNLLYSLNVYYPMAMNHTNFQNVNIPTNGITDTILKSKEGIIDSVHPDFNTIRQSLILPKAFINAGKVLPGIFIAKYFKGSTTVLGNKSINNSSVGIGNIYNNSKRFDSITFNNFNNNSLNPDNGNDVIYNAFKSKNLVFGPDDKAIETRFNQDLSFNTIFIRNMLNDLGIAHASYSLKNSTNNCSWIGHDSVKPLSGYSVVDNGNTWTDCYTKTINNQSYSYDKTKIKDYTHNGQNNGVLGLSEGYLELLLGMYLNLETISNGSTISNYKLNIFVSNNSTDFRTLSNTWVTNISNKSTLPGLNKKFTNVNQDYIPSNILNSGLISTKTNKTSYPVRLYNTYNPLAGLSNIYTNSTGANCNNDSVLDYYKVHTGVLGNFIEKNDISPRTNYYGHDYNNLSKFDYNFDSINIGDGVTSFFITNRGGYEASEKTNNISYYMLPLAGGTLTYINKNNVLGISDIHYKSLTWYRLGYNLSNLANNNALNIPVVSRLVILPDMSKIKNYVTSGLYDNEWSQEIKNTGDSSGIGTCNYKKKINDIWS